MGHYPNLPALRKRSYGLAEGEQVRLILREEGAGRFEAEVLPDGLDETVVIAQLRGEPPLETMRRAVARISSIERSGRKIANAVMLVAPSRDVERSASRGLVIRALLSHMASSRFGELLISADAADDDAHLELAELTSLLSDEYARAGIGVELRLRTGDSSPVASSEPPFQLESDGAAA